MVAYERGRLKWFWLQSVDSYPTDWMHLKQQLREAMTKALMVYGKTEVAIALDMHTGGSRGPAGTGGTYAKRPIPHRRERIAFFRRVQINRQTWEITVKQAPFISWRISHIREEYWRIERGKEWRRPPLIPSWYKPENPKTFLMQPADYPSTYRKPSRSTYGENNGGSYPATSGSSSYATRMLKKRVREVRELP